MPNVTLHLLLADRVLDAWSPSRRSPFQESRGPASPILADPGLRHAFRLGAFGPDLGYFPGGHPLLSNLAHCVRSGTLTRELLRRAATPLQQAFALGWVTHVIADRQLHPVVGRGVADVRRATTSEWGGGRGCGFVSADADPEGHVRVETGVDAWISSLYPALRRERFVPIFEADSIRFLAEAYAAAYGVEFSPRDFLASHRATAEMASRALAAIGLLSARSDRPTSRLGSATMALAGAATRVLGRGGLAVAFLSPLPPPPWLRIAVAEEVLGFVPRVEAALEDPEAALPDVNLDTGLPDGMDPDHVTTRETLRTLAALRAGPSISTGRAVRDHVPATSGAREG